jgi:hypothetical protein
LQNDTSIQVADPENNLHQWWFRSKRKWYQSERVLDPYKTVFENNIKENMVIICERLEKSSNGREF